MEKSFQVYDAWSEKNPILLGNLYVNQIRGKEVYSFQFDDIYIREHKIILLDPDLEMTPGRQYPPENRLWGVFADSCPDRWGRMLLQKRENLRAANEKRKPGKLLDSDYLAGVYDEGRMGALRFKAAGEDDFISHDEALSIPPFLKLRDLEYAACQLETSDKDITQWLKMIMAPGSSLGGARPKATVKDTDGSLWIAKFPSRHDDWDVGAWEMVLHNLAAMCGLDVPEARLERFSANGSTFLVKRFDRAGSRRIHFASALTLLGKTDGVSDASYLDMVELIDSVSKNPAQDKRELFSRLVFNIVVSNTDDHLRNHGFILKAGNCWQLSPVYDVNLSFGKELSLLIDYDSAELSLDTALKTAVYYGLSQNEAAQIIDTICKKISSNWRKAARKYKLPEREIKMMDNLFLHQKN